MIINPDIPKSLFEVKYEGITKATTQNEAGILLLDIYKSYEDCKTNLKAIEGIINGK